MTEDYERECDRYVETADWYVRLFIYVFLAILIGTLTVSGCHSAAKQRDQHATHDNKPLVSQRYDYWSGRS